MPTLAIASGKGGTGKTSLAVNLASYLAGEYRLLLADLDVEAPDCAPYFGSRADSQQAPRLLQEVYIPVPQADDSRCNGCGACSRACHFGALVAIKNTVRINELLCKGCGHCVRVCPTGALQERPVSAGKVYALSPLPGHAPVELLYGLLNIGDIRTTAVIDAVKKKAAEATASAPGLTLRDCPPGASCPAVRAIHGADYCILVAEPTAFSLHDMEKTARMVLAMHIPAGIVVNKAGAGSGDVAALARKLRLPVLAELPWQLDIAEHGARAETALDVPEMIDFLFKLKKALQQMKLLGVGEGGL